MREPRAVDPGFLSDCSTRQVTAWGTSGDGTKRSITGRQVPCRGRCHTVSLTKKPRMVSPSHSIVRKARTTCTLVYAEHRAAAPVLTLFFAPRTKVDKRPQAIAPRAQPSTPTRLR